jgi:hypothetical protein
MGKLNLEQKRALQGWLKSARKLNKWTSSNHVYAAFLRGRLDGYSDVLVLGHERLYLRLIALEMKLSRSDLKMRFLP